MTNNKGSTKNTMVSLPVGLAKEAHKRNINVSDVCADALSRRIASVDAYKEHEAARLVSARNSWASNLPGATGTSTPAIEDHITDAIMEKQWLANKEAMDALHSALDGKKNGGN